MTFMTFGTLEDIKALLATAEVPGIRVHYRISKIFTSLITQTSDIIMSEEHHKIQKYLIKSTPYGELNEVLKDL